MIDIFGLALEGYVYLALHPITVLLIIGICILIRWMYLRNRIKNPEETSQ